MSNEADNRFQEIHYESHGMSESYRVVTDRATGVCYLLHRFQAVSSITPLLNADGSPVVWR